MKQHITTEDLHSLIPAHKETLRTWWKPSIGDVYYTNYLGDHEIHVVVHCDKEMVTSEWADFQGQYETHRKRVCHPLFSIGQMIDFIQNRTALVIYPDHISLGTTRKFRNDELCDSLWEAVQYILK